MRPCTHAHVRTRQRHRRTPVTKTPQSMSRIHRREHSAADGVLSRACPNFQRTTRGPPSLGRCRGHGATHPHPSKPQLPKIRKYEDANELTIHVCCEFLSTVRTGRKAVLLM